VSLPLGVVIDLSNKLEKDLGTAAKAAALAKEFDISNHDAKANLLFLRLRMETLLRDIARRADLPDDSQKRSMRWLSSQLVSRGLVQAEINSAIADISPILNRELHESETYLTAEEFSSLQRLSLNVIAALTSIVETQSANQEKSGRVARK
jgi:hypothetical protein